MSSLPLMVHDEQWRDRFNESERDGLIEIATSTQATNAFSPRTLLSRAVPIVHAELDSRVNHGESVERLTRVLHAVGATRIGL